jgi:hypothetical protein
VVDGDRADPAPVHEGPVAAVEVLEHPHAVVEAHQRVPPRHPVVLEADVGPRVAADQEGGGPVGDQVMPLCPQAEDPLGS